MWSERAANPAPSCVSMKSDQSMDDPFNFSSGPVTSVLRRWSKRAANPAPSCVSMKSDQSMDDPFNFSSGPVTSVLRMWSKRAANPAPSCVSMKSDQSMDDPFNFSSGPVTSVLRYAKESVGQINYTEPLTVWWDLRENGVRVWNFWGSRVYCRVDSLQILHKSPFISPWLFNWENWSTYCDQKKPVNISKEKLESVFKGIMMRLCGLLIQPVNELEDKIISLVKNELKRFKNLLSSDYPA
ncbi:hypothetical protein P4O66_023130 [Electrophorus voltai]|uniref:Uncharacterized protein n=1 Tax=Electrophorus voltai TaxID=2609070 RepID=A0AAD8YR55_9TELE|nr:hypothetical protein P4O66_023130 [Electrophorus voltai]